MYTKQMFTLMDWTCLYLNLETYAQHFLRTLMKKKRQQWHFVVKDTLYHHGLWVYCQIAQIQFSILPRLVYAGELFGSAKMLAWHNIVLSSLFFMCVKVIALMIYFSLMILWYPSLYVCMYVLMYVRKDKVSQRNLFKVIFILTLYFLNLIVNTYIHPHPLD